MDKFYIKPYKNVDFNKTHIEQHFTRRLGHQLILIDKLTMNNISLGLPLVSQAQNNKKEEIVPHNDRGKEIVSQVQNQKNPLEKILASILKSN